MTHEEACLALNMLPAVGPVRVRRLLEIFDSPESILSAPQNRLQQVEGIGQEVAHNISHWESVIDLAKEVSLIEKNDVRILTQASPDYPALLNEIHDPPLVLYCKGDVTKKDHHALGVVGSRRTTHYGQEAAKKLSYQIAYAGITVISGLARGIDTAAHTAALAAKGRTVAVIGAGLCELYPPENRELAERITRQGAVVSEFPLHTKPDRQTFPMRNRIVSGWSFGTLVVECGLNSGAMITAGQAADQGRSMYAVPGPIDRPHSQGCNRLIQQGARLVMDAADILDDMLTLFPKLPEMEESSPQVTLNQQETKVYEAIGRDETAIDKIITKSSLPSATVSSTLLALELKRLVKQLPGKRFVRTS